MILYRNWGFSEQRKGAFTYSSRKTLPNTLYCSITVLYYKSVNFRSLL